VAIRREETGSDRGSKVRGNYSNTEVTESAENTEDGSWRGAPGSMGPSVTSVLSVSSVFLLLQFLRPCVIRSLGLWRSNFLRSTDEQWTCQIV
jgi:hypothetical protein